MAEKRHGTVLGLGLAMLAGTAAAQGNFVTHETPQGGAAPDDGRPSMVFSAPAYAPNAAAPQPALGPMLGGQPAYQPHVPPYAPALPQPAPQQPAPGYAAPQQQQAPAPAPAQPVYSSSTAETPPPAYAPSPAPLPVAVPQPPVTPSPPATPDEIRFREESDTSRRLLALQDAHDAALKALEVKRQQRKAAILDQFEKDAADPAKVVGLAERLRAAMAELEALHQTALAEAERRYTQARLDVLAASPSRIGE